MKKAKTKWKCCLSCVFAVQAVFVAAVHADLVVLENGETLSGTFSRIREDTLVFRTSLEGQMMTPLSNVKTLSVATPLYLGMNDGRVYYGRLEVQEDRQVIAPLDGGAPVSVKVTDILETLPIPTPPAGMPEEEAKEWRLDMAPGIQWRNDGRSSAAPVLRLDDSGKLKDWDSKGDAEIPDHFPAYLRARGDSVYGAEDGLRPRLGADFEGSLDRALSDGASLNLGIYQALTAESTRSFSLMATLSLEQEHRLEERRFLSGAVSETDTRLGLRLGLRFYRLLTDSHSLSASSGASTELFASRSDSGYMAPVSNRLRLRLDLSNKYESPSLANDSAHWNDAVGTGAQMDF